MARKNLDGSSNGSGRPRAARSSPKNFKTIAATPPPTQGRSPPKSSSPLNSPRTSPGLIAGHYAGCKFTEPPAPSTLPPPPKHWTAMKNNIIENDISHQLKVLLKVQA